MMQTKFMPWIDLLPEVDSSVLRERDRLSEYLDMAEALEKRAAALRERAKAGRSVLMDKVARRWSLEDIEQAGNAAGDRGQPIPPSFVRDAELREALRALDGAASPLEVLEAFHKGRVIRQHNLFSTATEEDRHATLHRVFDWWNYGAVPLLTRLQG